MPLQTKMKLNLIKLLLLFSVFSIIGCSATNRLEWYTSSPDDITVDNIKIWYRLKPTTTTKHVPFLYWRHHDHEPYYFHIEAFNHFEHKIEKPTTLIINNATLIVKDKPEFEIITEPQIIEITFDQWWNDTYSKKQERFKYTGVKTFSSKLPIDFSKDDKIMVRVGLTLIQENKKINEIHEIHFTRNLRESKSGYWDSMMRI